MITYTIGDATLAPPYSIIAHICNNRGGWGAGFSGALSKRYPQAEKAYRGIRVISLGAVQFVEVGDGIIIANMIAQNGYTRPGYAAINYPALALCLRRVWAYAIDFNPPMAVHMPRIGTDRAGGKWEMIEPVIVAELCEKGVEVTVYDYE